MKLIGNWRKAWRFFSVQAKAASVAMLAGWQALPANWQAMIPLKYVMGIAVAVLVLGIVGRLIEQPKAH